jgi:hypothetical protein
MAGVSGRFAWLVVTLVASVWAVVSGQALRFENHSLCELLRNASRFSGRLVSVRAELVAVREMLLADSRNRSCGLLAIESPENPGVRPKPNFALIRDQSYGEFERGFPVLLPTAVGARGSIYASFEGRFDWTPAGSGHMRLRSARLILHRVFDVDVRPAP